MKRWTLPLLGATFFYGGLLLASEMVGISRTIFAEGAPFRWLVPLLLITLPENLGYVLPMAALLGGLLGTQQLSDSSEMVASHGMGVGLRAILKPWGLLSLGLVSIALVNAHIFVPHVSSLQSQLETQMREETKTRRLRPGASPWYLPSSAGENACIWVARDGEIHLMNVTNTEVQHVVAKRLNWWKENKANDAADLVINLEDLEGCRYSKDTGNVGHLQQKSQNLRIPMQMGSHIFPPTPDRYLATQDLLRERTLVRWVELSRRFTIPFATASLLLLGIAMGLHHPRFHRGGAIVKSLGVILLYYFLLQYFENNVKRGSFNQIYVIFILPFIFLAFGLCLIFQKSRPHKSRRTHLPNIRKLVPIRWLKFSRSWFFGAIRIFKNYVEKLRVRRVAKRGILSHWTSGLWWKQWGSVMGTFLTLDFLMEFASLASDLSKNKVSYWVFFQYWFWNLPPFLATVFPVAFLLGGVLAFSEATLSREWVALKAGGTSLIQWIKSGTSVWASILALTFLIQSWVAPAVTQKADNLYRHIKNRPERMLQVRPWLNLSSTGVLWFLDHNCRWGFPLKTRGEAPVLLRWEPGRYRTEELSWSDLNFVPGGEASRMFPDSSLRETANSQEADTMNLVRWQRWAPDPVRAGILWGRLLNWLAGPSLLFALLSHAFPSARGGRGQALGFSLVAGLLYLGMQTLFSGAAESGEIPAIWGVVAPMLVMVSFGLLRLNRLRT